MCNLKAHFGEWAAGPGWSCGGGGPKRIWAVCGDAGVQVAERTGDADDEVAESDRAQVTQVQKAVIFWLLTFGW